ncbi:hypothetical protein VE03_07233 [Pseudogymnoascus sp. 23342-1-I1]|nr:hypothetical protein VE03_07233 [Pseudogymnoascus sp. 23342-1-I1]
MATDDKKQLWEINDVILNSNYSAQESEFDTYYTLTTGRTDLPAGFFAKERNIEIERREEVERIAKISGLSAQNERQAGGTYDPSYQLPSQKIANAPYIKDVLSSGSRARINRVKAKD